VAYDEKLATRVRRALRRHGAPAEREMFGGVTFLLRGHMCCGIVGDDLVLRVGPDRYEQALARPHARTMDFTGRSLKGMVYVGPPGVADDAELRRWIGEAAAFIRALPARPAKSRRARRRRTVAHRKRRR